MYIKKTLACLLTLSALLLSSCINDDLDECNFNLRFDYSWNMLNSNSFAEQVDEVQLFVFDKEGTYIKTIHDKGAHIQKNNYSITVDNLPRDTYHFVAVGMSNTYSDALSHLELPTLTPSKSMIDQLKVKLKGIDSKAVFKSTLNNFLIGQVSTHNFEGKVNLIIPTKKVNKNIRVVLIDESQRAITTNDFSIRIEDSNGNSEINHDYQLLPQGALTYLPHYFEKVKPRNQVEAKSTVSQINAIAAEFATLRLSENHKVRLKIDDKNGKTIFNKNLIDLLYLLKEEGHIAKDMSFQEYLDREDQFAVSLYVSGDTSTWISTRIIINGWVINLIDLDL